MYIFQPLIKSKPQIKNLYISEYEVNHNKVLLKLITSALTKIILFLEHFILKF